LSVNSALYNSFIYNDDDDDDDDDEDEDEDDVRTLQTVNAKS